MDKVISRRDEVLKAVEDQMRMAGQRVEELSKELYELNQHRDDLMAAKDIAEQQYAGLIQILDRATAPQVEVEADDNVTAARERHMKAARQAVREWRD